MFLIGKKGRHACKPIDRSVGEIEPAGEGEENWHVIKDLYVAFAAAKV